jgi:hypothetical protein
MTDDSNTPADGERQGGKPLGDAEARKKGPWAERADEGLVPAELRGSEGDDPAEPDHDDGELGASVTGETTGSDEPATEDGIDLHAGDNADATTDGGPDSVRGVEPDLRDAAAGPRQTDVRSADS